MYNPFFSSQKTPFTNNTSFDNFFKNFNDLNIKTNDDIRVVEIPGAVKGLLESLDKIADMVQQNAQLAAKVLTQALNNIAKYTTTLDTLSFTRTFPSNTKTGGYIFLIHFVDYVYVGYTKEPKKRIWTLKNNDNSFDNSTIVFSNLINEYVDEHIDIHKTIVKELEDKGLCVSQNIFEYDETIFETIFSNIK